MATVAFHKLFWEAWTLAELLELGKSATRTRDFPCTSPTSSSHRLFMFHDEFEQYDLSEFTEEDLVQFDIDATNKLLDYRSEIPPLLQQDIPAAGPSHGSLGGGPALDIAFESLTDAFVEEIPKLAVSAGTCTSPLPVSTNTNARISRRPSPRHEKSLYEQFCSWKKGFSVTDLVSPVWLVLPCHYFISSLHYIVGVRCSMSMGCMGRDTNHSASDLPPLCRDTAKKSMSNKR